MSYDNEIRTLKCVLIGDQAVGKTSLIVSYTTNRYPEEYKPTTFDNYSVEVKVDKKPIRLQLCDTAGQDKFDSIRPLSYPDSDVFVLVYSVVNPQSYHNIIDRWLPEITAVSPNTPVILVGTHKDERYFKPTSQCIPAAKGSHLAKQIRAYAFYECSSLTSDNLKQMFDSAILAGLEGRRNPTKRAPQSRLKQGFHRFISITRKLI